MIDVLKIDHLSQVVPELDPQIEFLERVLGLRLVGRYDSDSFVSATLAIPGFSEIGWELMAPRGADSYLQRFLDSTLGPGLHHLAMKVGSVEETRAEIRAAGNEPWDEDGKPNQTYLHPAHGGQGFLFQFYDSGDEDSWYETPPFEDDGEHTLGIIAVNHIAHAHPDRDKLGEWYERMLGFETFAKTGSNENPDAEFNTRVLDAPTRQMRIEVISPTREDSFIQRFLDERGTAVHHLTVEVADWDRAVAALEHHGIRTFGERSSSTDGVPWKETFIHPKVTGGVLLQFFWQAEPGVWI
jgi:methylmalonyl-CoA/ethylmalonyl-CoA epimerase